jgi:peptidoglycan-N-acetylglucosamine deacetylase
LKKNYMDAAADSLQQSRSLSNAVFERDIKHVLLLHIGSFETVMLPHLLDLLKERGFQLITLPDAESDPAYSMHPDLPGNWDGTFLEQWMRARHLALPPDSSARLAKLDGTCR